MKKRFATGVIFGASAYAIAWAAGAAPLWCWLIGAVVAVAVWFGARALEAASDAIDDLT